VGLKFEKQKKNGYPKICWFLSLQRHAMNYSLFNPEVLKRYCGPGGRVIIFAFARAAGKLIGRLLESAK